MTRTWLLIAGCACGVIVLGFFVTRPRAPADSAAVPAPATLRTPRSPWVARRQPAAPQLASHGSWDAGPADQGAVADSRGEPIQVAGATPPGPAVVARPAGPAAGATADRRTPVPETPARESNAAADEAHGASGPALALSFDKTTQAEKSGAAPLVEEGVTLEAGGAHFAADAQFALPAAGNVDGAAGTISFWIQPDWSGDDPGDASIVQLRDRHVWENRLQIFKNGPFMRFLFTDDTGVEGGVGTDIRQWKAGDWHMVTATWGDGVTALYLDGELIGQRPYDGDLELGPGTPLFIGSNFPGDGPGARGVLSNFQIYARALPPDEVAALLTQRR